MTLATSMSAKALKGVRILSLSLNLPGPAALQRLRRMGASCRKFEPPTPTGALPPFTADPMSQYSARAYAALHDGIRVQAVDLKSSKGQAQLRRTLVKTDILLTSFRPSALTKLGLAWKTLHAQYPTLSMVSIVGAPGAGAEAPGHDLTYQAENNLLVGYELPATLYADMTGALTTTEAVLQAVLLQRQKRSGRYIEVALSDAAAHLALPRVWGLTLPGTVLGGGHAGYAVYPCQDGRVALATLEPHFAKRMCAVIGLPWTTADLMLQPDTRAAIANFIAPLTCQAIDRLASTHDLPLCTILEI